MARGAGKEFLGRPCRIEMVRANRTFILRNYVGGDVSINEARQILEQFGPIGRVEEITAETAYANGIRQGVMVEFKNYDPDRDVQAVSVFIPFETSRLPVTNLSFLSRRSATTRSTV